MMHLIRLEFKKGRFTGYLWGSLLAYAAIAGLIMVLYFGADSMEEMSSFRSYQDMFNMIDLCVRATFIVFASVLLSRLIINEFRDKTIALLFAYPLSRKKLIFAKLSMVFFWTLANVIVGNLLIDMFFIAVNSGVGYVTGPLTSALLLKQGIYVLAQAFGAAGMSLLPLVLGLRKESSSITVASAVFIVLIVCSNNGGFSLSSVIAIPLLLSILGILITYWSFRNIDRMDVG